MTGYAKPEDVFSTYEKLEKKERRTLHGIACYYRRGTSFADPLDLLHEALARSAEGRRRWPLRMDFCAHIMLSMRSIADAERNLHANTRASSAGFEGLMEWGSADIEIDFHPSAEAQASRAQESALAECLVAQARECWEASRDRQALDTLDGMLMDMSTAEICAWRRLDACEVKAAKKRILRKLGSLARQ